MTNAAIIGVVGYHNTGKTTLICKLIERLSERGYFVSTIKNIPKDGFSIDIEGTDTWKHAESGAGLVVASTPDETSFIFKSGMKFDEIVRLADVATSPDLILVEGHKTENIPKIVLGDIEMDGGGRRYNPDTDDFEEILDYVIEAIEIARIYAKLPKMDCGKCGCDDCMKMAEAIVRGEKAISDCVVKEGLVTVTVGGDTIPMGFFVQNVISKTIFGMVSSLKGVDSEDTDADITIEIKHAEK
ncbi:MAG: molybdopterin-guanine dinucleotide biosynthesis protein B [Euryarchaeota archaeon]|nr:molybdopterin-guanine dinucleotide biosynthesis protein B [Euryarchaeota archaeon]